MSKFVNKLSRSTITVALILIAVGVTCFAAFGLIGSSIDQDGFLHEPFPLIPIGELFIALGAITVFVSVLQAIFPPLR
jgi:hypothetical protein